MDFGGRYFFGILNIPDCLFIKEEWHFLLNNSYHIPKNELNQNWDSDRNKRWIHNGKWADACL